MPTGARVLQADNPCPIVVEKTFILATREVGYRSPAHAIAELVDNAIQAAARTVQVFIFADPSDPIVAVLDDGRGMNSDAMRTALQFGGTDRFDDRSGLGRFGMGLPCSSISQARRVDLFSWRSIAHVNHTYLDVDEIVQGRFAEIPIARPNRLPNWIKRPGKTGTLVVWRKCDKMDCASFSNSTQHIHAQLGRIFRHFIWGGMHLEINNQPVAPIDPLFCHSSSPLAGAKEYGTPLSYDIQVPGRHEQVSKVQVRFSELPVADWYDMPTQDKRRLGIVKGGGVSLVRARREIAYGWYFLGEKRRENYDDWWRCEISFGPELDDYFHPTHTKQEIHPGADLEAVLTPDIEALARTLNSRVRASFAKLKPATRNGTAQRVAAKEKYLPPLCIAGTFGRHRPAAKFSRPIVSSVGRLKYSLSVEQLRQDAFYSVQMRNGVIHLVLNKDHAFFERIYAPLCHKNAKELRAAIDCFLFALARAEAEAKSEGQRYWYNRKRTAWSNVLSTFLGS